jgi:hypothetical protein
MPQSIEMTRQQLYELVWSKSVAAAAASIPMSHANLKELCLEHQVPIPSLGHWRKSPARQAADKVPLPLTMGEQRIWIRRVLQRRPTGPRLREQTNANLSSESLPSENVAHWHACTKRTKSALAQATPDRRWVALEVQGAGVASIKVAPETVPRALGVLDGLIRAVERRGHSIAMQTSPAAMLAINGAFVPVKIFEKFVRIDEPADAAELKRRHVYERTYPKFFRMMDLEGGWTLRPTGELTIILSNGYERLPSRWADSALQRVESRVDDVAAAAVVHAQAITARRQRIEARTAERRETEQQLRQRDTETDLQSRRIAFVKRYAAMLEEAERFDRVVRHIRETNDYPSIKMHEFLTWSEAYISDLRQRCSAPAVDDELAEIDRWGSATTDRE